MTGPTISYAITAHNEHEELKRLLGRVCNDKTDQDEVVVQIDSTATKEVREVLAMFDGKIRVVEFPLQKDFATFKNNIKSVCEKDYIFFIDADELIDENFMVNLPYVLEMNPEVEMYWVPRWNTVNGLTKEHVNRWGWNVDELGRVNWPDLQGRLAKNIPEIKWEGKVHERLMGYKTVSRMPDDFRLYHPKTIERQEKQNKLYKSI
jgi:glycosyltransferase involved in cell wall biosynthesis